MGNRTTKVTLTAQVQGYIDGMREAAKATRETGSASEKLTQQREAMEQMSRTMLIAGGAVAAGLGLSAKAAMDWDSAWAGVTKTVDGTPKQLAAVEQGLRDLTGVLPASHTEIAAVAEAAGQLGIETPNVVAFTKTMIDLGETTNLSSEQAAMSLARFMNIMGTAQGEVSNLGSSIVGLGNNFATTESEILEMSMRLAKSGVQIGLSEGEVLGLATALSSVGIEAEAGGSAMSKVMIDIAASIEKGGARLEMFAKTAGMSADEFAQKWKASPAEALAAFVKGLANAEKQGGSTLGVLAELGITEVRMRDALLGSAAAADQFASAMEMGNEQFEKNNALTDEAEKRYATTASKLSIMGNKVVDAAISLGEHLLPAIEGVAEGVGGFADMLSGLDGPMGGVVAWTGVIAAGILLTGGVALGAVSKLAAYKVALETLNITSSSLAGKFSGIASFFTGPWGIALVAAGAAWGTFQKTIEKDIPTLTELETALKQTSDATQLLKSASERGGTETLWLGDYYDKLKDLKELLNRNWWEGGQWNAELNGARDSVKRLGDAFGQLASYDLPLAQSKFKLLADHYKLTHDEQLKLLEMMPGYKDALIAQADALGVNVTEGSKAQKESKLLALALGEIGPAAEEAGDGAQNGAGDLEGLGDAAKQTQEQIAQLADEIRGFNAPAFDMREANRQLEESLFGLSEALGTNGANFDITTEAGRATQAALDDVAAATNNAAAAIVENGGSQAEMNAKLAEGRQRLIDMLAPYMGSTEAAAAYVDQLGLISPEKVTEIRENAKEAQGNVNVYQQSLDKIPNELFTKLWVERGDSQAQLDAHLAALNNIPGYKETVIRTVIAQTGALRGQVAAAYSANGNLFAYANGGIASFDAGGFATGIYKGGAPIHKFAEPETGWEAYISGKASERDRNRQIWVETGNRLGINVWGSAAPVLVSLAGATFAATIDGQPFTIMIDKQIAGALAPVKGGSLSDALGVV